MILEGLYSFSVLHVKAIPLHAWTGPEGSRRLRLPDFKTIVLHVILRKDKLCHSSSVTGRLLSGFDYRVVRVRFVVDEVTVM